MKEGMEMGAVWFIIDVHVLKLLRVLCRCEGRILKLLLLENSETSHQITLFIYKIIKKGVLTSKNPPKSKHQNPPPLPKNQRAALVE